MSSLLYRINSVLSRVVAGVPLGTNLGLFHLLWMLLSGRLLQSRGAVIPGSPILGLLRMPSGAAGPLWRMAVAPPSCLEPGRTVREEGCFQAHLSMGAIARSRVTWTAFVHVFRTARPLLGRSGQSVTGHSRGPCGPCRVGRRAASGRALPPGTERGDRGERSPVQTRLLQRVQRSWPTTKRSSAIGVASRADPSGWHATLCVARSHQLHGAAGGPPGLSRQGRTPRRGTLVRPPASVQAPHHGRATTRPHETWQSAGAPKAPLRLHAEFWDGLVLADARRAPRRSVRRSSMIHALTSRCC